jgi:hypothetical protein
MKWIKITFQVTFYFLKIFLQAKLDVDFKKIKSSTNWWSFDHPVASAGIEPASKV